MTEAVADDLSLAADFPEATRQDWMKLVTAALKGAPFEKLQGRTYDGTTIEPLYQRRVDASPIIARDVGGPWQVLQRVDHPDPAAANAEALHDLENGATGLSLVSSGAIGAYGFGIVASETAITRILDGIHLDAGIGIEMDFGPDAMEAAPLVSALVKRKGIAPGATDIRFGLDPLGALAFSGSGRENWKDLAPGFAGLIVDLESRGFRGPFAVADGRAVHAAGGSEAQELAFALSSAVAYLRALEAGGIALDDARRKISFRLAADADQFLTMAKFRALRRLWARVEEACGVPPRPVFVAAETAWRMMTKRDPWVNLLRTTIAAFSAGLGGADAVGVLPFTAAIGVPDRFARRIARNTQLILLEESNLAKVTDPAAGSGGIENLTREICKAAWTLFQEIEQAGGTAAALEAGLIQHWVAEVRARREAAVARRKDPLTGTSEFPDISEAPVAVLDVAPLPVAPVVPAAVLVEALPRLRLAEPFEKLRDASDRQLAATGARPRIFLATLGPLAAFTARATYAKNFFEAGGIEAVAGEGSGDQAAVAEAFRASGARIACLCSSDQVYASQAVQAATALEAAGAARIYLAGRPGGLEPSLKAAGVTGFIYAGCNVVATLQAAHGTGGS